MAPGSRPLSRRTLLTAAVGGAATAFLGTATSPAYGAQPGQFLRRRLMIGSVSRFGLGLLSLTDTAFAPPVGIALDSRPNGISLSPDGGRAYVATEFAPGLSVIDVTDAAVVNQVEVGGFANSVVLSPDGERAYVTIGSGASDGTRGGVVVVATGTGEVLARIQAGLVPRAATISPDGTRLLIADEHLPGVTLIDTATNEVVGTVETSQPVVKMAVDDRKLVLASPNELVIAEPPRGRAKGRVTSTVPLDGYPGGLALSRSGALGFVSLYTGVTTPAAFTVVNLEASRVIRQHANDQGHGDLALTGDGLRAFVLDKVNRRTTAMDAETGAATASLLSPDTSKPTCLALLETT